MFYNFKNVRYALDEANYNISMKTKTLSIRELHKEIPNIAGYIHLGYTINITKHKNILFQITKPLQDTTKKKLYTKEDILKFARPFPNGKNLSSEIDSIVYS